MVIALTMTLSIGFLLKSGNDTIEFYVIKDDEHIETAVKILAFDDRSIESYDWGAHQIIFTKDFLENSDSRHQNQILIEGGSRLLGCKGNDKFVVYVNEKKIYEGIFQPPLYQSFLPGGPIISDIDKGIKIEVHYGEDLRSNQELYNALEANNLLLNLK